MKKFIFILASLFTFENVNAQDSQICFGGERNYSVDDSEGSSGTTGATYTWTILETDFNGSGLTPPGAPSDTNDVQLDWGTTAPGIYTLQVIESVGGICEGTPVQHTVEVVAKPEAPIVSTNAPLCSGQTGQITINGAPNATIQYSIDGAASTTLVLDNTGQYVLDIPNLTSDTTIVITDIIIDLAGGVLCANSGLNISETLSVSPEVITSPISAN